MPTKRNTDPPFEECLQQLDEIVRKLEAGGLPLEESVTLFEEAMRLAKLCNTRLDAAELRITRITASGREVSFDPDAQRPARPAAALSDDEFDDLEAVAPLEDDDR